MPLKLEYIDDAKGIYVTLEGKVTLYDYKEFEEGDSVFVLAKNDKHA